jgi:hypothetical protein
LVDLPPRYQEAATATDDFHEGSFRENELSRSRLHDAHLIWRHDFIAWLTLCPSRLSSG